MEHLKYILASIIIGFSFQNCTDVIDVDLLETDPLVVVDAWLDNDKAIQTIRLRESSGFFDANFIPVISGATVTITDDNNTVFSFIEDGTSGNYIWVDTTGSGFGMIGDTYSLSININSATYTAISSMNRVPVIDSISYEEYDPSFVDIEEEGWEAEFFATDPLGKGDNYWIKTFKNDQFLNKPEEINLAFDAGFTGGSDIDGIPFIQPIRTSINRVADSGDDAEDTDEYPPYISGDTIKVELHAINNDAFEFLLQAQVQMTLGNNGIFAPPLENVPTNISSPIGAVKAVGFFNVSAVESFEEIVP